MSTTTIKAQKGKTTNNGRLDLIQELQQKLMLRLEDAEYMHAKFDDIQLSIFRDTKSNVSCDPCERQYSEC